ncbi:hypothetical protein GE300_20255 [Rhodobacteraceae bacterium 2CG4]|uniref:Uncharacterized protein n=1 Tax=Halovulum marinum TaxID=2662447 RepID=A0A6L5Z777_9RHOB|nr:hypothetical protein [Halovulum marinum]MSU91895.1 hypothetical protein [Halovulum marinum]
MPNKTEPACDFAIAAPAPPKSEAERREEIVADCARSAAWTEGNLISPEEIRDRQQGGAPARFNVISLPAWIELASRAGVEAIPLRQIAEMPTSEYVLTMDHLTNGKRITEFENQVLGGLRPGEILRFEQVAPMEVKAALAAGGEISAGLIDGVDGRRFPAMYDERFYSTLLDLGAPKIRAYARPFVQPALAEGELNGRDGKWPVEFRVFVVDGEITGVANYYRQMHLDEQRDLGEDGIRSAVDGSLEAAKAMLAEMARLGLTVGSQRLAPEPEHGGDFTLDFLLAEDGRVLFLEGGPAGLSFADPCAFLTDGAREISLEGVALSARRPPVPFEDWNAGVFRYDGEAPVAAAP